ncbi:coatomer protein complex, subunit alpha (xenin) [Nematocida displodere]|uniref:Coatomer protein complex, subunit alpha (Xenin) n=1 Tax=Nematocida displodere TaxID=1805483 RepID=A0A177EE74_9MICR|nr:coatomer protein complex, subunit alpha (xenin) [Nematocida displodere]
MVERKSDIEHCRCIMEEETQRVKSIAFHPCKKIVLVGLHNGKIQAWNYLYKSLVFELAEHEGPVRVVVFHHLIERFASAGDDCLIRIWNYKTRTVENVFKGHTDYVRSLEFHKNLPWVISASDDQTVRIWNFQSKKQIACLTGHTHYVMCARFITDSLFVSVSLDQTIRIWDYSALKVKSQKTVMDMLGVPEVSIKHIVDGHDRGINWVAAQPGTDSFATGGDDTSIRVWDASGDGVFETDALHGHHNCVSALCYATQEVLISGSEDGTLKIWDTKRRKAVKTISVESRFWCIAVNSEEKIFAAGHDSGFKVYTLEKLAPVFAVKDAAILFHRGQDIIRTEMETRTETRVTDAQPSLRRLYASGETLLLSYESSYMVKGKDTFRGTGYAILAADAAQEPATQLVVASEAEVQIKDVYGRELRTVSVEAEKVFHVEGHGLFGQKGNLLFRIGADPSIGENILLPEPAAALIGNKSVLVAVTEKCLVVLDSFLNQLSLVEEVVAITSAILSEETIFYTTPMHIKFAFRSGDSAALMSTEEPLWLVKAENGLFTVINRESAVTEVEVDMIEWSFKHALETGDKKRLKECIDADGLIGQSSLAYLIRKGSYEEAFEHIDSVSVRIDLCIKMKKFKEAYKYAQELNEPEVFDRIALAAINTDTSITEACFKQTKNLHGFILLYIAMNRADKIEEMLLECTDPMYAAVAAIITGNNEKLCSLISVKRGAQNIPVVPSKPAPHATTTATTETDTKGSSKETILDGVAQEDAKNLEEALDTHTTSHHNVDAMSRSEVGDENGSFLNLTSSDHSGTEEHSSNLSLDEGVGSSDSQESAKKEDLETKALPEMSLPERFQMLNRKRFQMCLKNVPSALETTVEVRIAMEAVTQGKFSTATSSLLVSMYQALRQIIAKEDAASENTLALCSTYLQGLAAEKLRRNTGSDKVAISCAIFFASLSLERAHRERALKSAVSVAYKKGNKHAALELSKELVKDFNCTDERISALADIKKPMKDAIFIDLSLPFCVDRGEYLEGALQCTICRAYNSNECKVCKCCFVTNLSI